MVVIASSEPAAPKNLTMDDFRSLNTKYGDLAKSSRFLVVIPPPTKVVNYNSLGFSAADLTYLCESAEMPGRGFMSDDARYYGPGFKIPYKTNYDDLNLTFLCRDNFIEREFFDNWLEVINPSNTYDFEYRSNYDTNLYIYQMSDIQNSDGTQQRYVYTLEHAYPLLINPQPVTWADDNFHRLTVTFTYTRWRRQTLDSTLTPPFVLATNGLALANNQLTGGTTIPLL